ncbi:hypothetical protein ALGA_0675 [Labilibaculum antarcticum]|uniref:YD repeat-containing protein n=2 Tax=Labilibaculum antarcticum TaxID=1717717 RepID=A0A1Y1CFH5_9BACT|nr:hypothetical protein ALGA_0675 [Labilibaculum antarcticum]
MKMKIIFSLFVLGFIFSCSSTKNTNKENSKMFNTILEASYGSKQSGALVREIALNQESSRKEFYDEQGVLVEYWSYEVDATLYEKTKLITNKDGEVIKSTTYDKDGNLEKYTTSEFDNNGKIIESRTFNSKDELISTQKNKYDINGNQISMSNTISESNITFKTTNEYNSRNQKSKEIEFEPDGRIKNTRTFTYDRKGNEIESELIRPNGEYTKFISEYDRANNITIQKWYDKEGKQIHQTSFEYVYDENNNWITKKRYSDGKLGFVWERQIEYK